MLPSPEGVSHFLIQSILQLRGQRIHLVYQQQHHWTQHQDPKYTCPMVRRGACRNFPRDLLREAHLASDGGRAPNAKRRPHHEEARASEEPERGDQPVLVQDQSRPLRLPQTCVDLPPNHTPQTFRADRNTQTRRTWPRSEPSHATICMMLTMPTSAHSQGHARGRCCRCSFFPSNCTKTLHPTISHPTSWKLVRTCTSSKTNGDLKRVWVVPRRPSRSCQKHLDGMRRLGHLLDSRDVSRSRTRTVRI